MGWLDFRSSTVFAVQSGYFANLYDCRKPATGGEEYRNCYTGITALGLVMTYLRHLAIMRMSILLSFGLALTPDTSPQGVLKVWSRWEMLRILNGNAGVHGGPRFGA